MHLIHFFTPHNSHPSMLSPTLGPFPICKSSIPFCSFLSPTVVWFAFSWWQVMWSTFSFNPGFTPDLPRSESGQWSATDTTQTECRWETDWLKRQVIGQQCFPIRLHLCRLLSSFSFWKKEKKAWDCWLKWEGTGEWGKRWSSEKFSDESLWKVDGKCKRNLTHTQFQPFRAFPILPEVSLSPPWSSKGYLVCKMTEWEVNALHRPIAYSVAFVALDALNLRLEPQQGRTKKDGPRWQLCAAQQCKRWISPQFWAWRVHRSLPRAWLLAHLSKAGRRWWK